MLVAFAGSLGGKDDGELVHTERLVDTAAAIELVHLASLVHDDILDDALVRRGRPALRTLWGDGMAVLTGDLLYARAFELVVPWGTDAVGYLTQAIAAMCEAEIEQRMARFDPDQGKAAYLARLRKKTGALLGCACACGAHMAGLDQHAVERLRSYGELLGVAFQIADDLLDWRAETADLGKPAGNDFLQGVITLPVIYALREPEGYAIREVLLSCREMGRSPEPREIEAIRGLVHERGHLEAAEATARTWARRAASFLEGLPVHGSVEPLRDFTRRAVDRRR